MPNTNPGYCLFRDSQGFDISRLPEPYRSWPKTSTDPSLMSIHNTQKNRSTLHRYTIQALLEYADEMNCDIGVVKIADGSYASEWTQPDGTTIIAHATKNGVLSAGRRDALTGKMTQLPSIGTSKTEFNDASILLLYLLIEADINGANGIAGMSAGTITRELLQSCRDEFAANGVIPEEWLRLVCDDLYYAVSYGIIPVNIRNGNISLLTERRLASNEFSTGAVICGKPDILVGKKLDQGSKGTPCKCTVKDAKVIAKDYTDTLSWSAEEEMMIPQIDENVEVPPEVMTILNRFLASRKWKNPLNNPCWRGTTAYGKSTGVKILACILHTPLLWMTCATTTETEDFLSKHVPNTGETAAGNPEMPTFDDIINDPEFAYEQITGEHKDGVTCEEAFQVYSSAIANNAGQPQMKNPFKIVESDFVRALTRGYIIEVQEFSRIRDSGTLVGLNNFSEPGSVIPLVDGTHVRRHKNAMVVWTDNIGYQSCRRVDGSVLRRMSYIIDSCDMPKERAIRRIKGNTGCQDDTFLEHMYEVWAAIAQYCKEQDITDEGTCSLMELESWVSLTMLDGLDAILETCREAVVSKVSSDPDTQKEIMESCVALALAREGIAC